MLRELKKKILYCNCDIKEEKNIMMDVKLDALTKFYQQILGKKIKYLKCLVCACAKMICGWDGKIL